MIFKQFFRGYENVWRVVGQAGIDEILQLDESEVNGILFCDNGPGVPPTTIREPEFSLDFLANFPNLTFLRVTRNEFNDIYIINNLRAIKHLFIRSHYSDSLDFSNMSNLNYLNVENVGRLDLSTIQSEKLESICIKHATNAIASHVEYFKQLKSVVINYGKLQSLEPLLQSPFLEQLELKNCTPRSEEWNFTESALTALSNLKLVELYNFRHDPKPLLSHCSEVLNLFLQSCPKTASISFIKRMPKLRQLILRDCKTIDSLEPIYERGWIDHLEISGSTIIENDSLDGLRNVAMQFRPFIMNRKHYQCKTSDFDSLPDGYLFFDEYERQNTFLHDLSVRKV